MSLGRLAALGAALAAGLFLLATGAPRAGDEQLTVAQAWPDAARGQVPGQLADATPYQPLFLVDPDTSVGTARSPDGERIRLLHRTGDTAVTLRDLPAADNPQFGGFTSDGEQLVWAESAMGTSGRGQTRIWAMQLGSPAPPREVTADTGDVTFFNSQYDLVIADGQVHWAAAAPGNDEPATEVRSVPLSGAGPVVVRRLPGLWAMSAWPWLVSALTTTPAIQLRDLETKYEVTVPTTPDELVTCSRSWCRVIVLPGASGPGRIELMRPDGTDRQPVADGLATAALVDVAVLDRFEVYTKPGSGGSAVSNQLLLLYDADRQRSYLVAAGVGMVFCRNGILAWSTGDNEALRWHALDLTSLD